MSLLNHHSREASPQLRRRWLTQLLDRVTRLRVSVFDVECEEAREAVSCELDGEDHTLTGRALLSHLSRCPACSAFASRAASIYLPDQVLLSKKPPAELMEHLRNLARHEQRHGERVHRRYPGWIPSRATIGTFALAGLPAAVAIAGAALGPWGSHSAIAPHLTPNGCIAPLLARHLWPGY